MTALPQHPDERETSIHPSNPPRRSRRALFAFAAIAAGIGLFHASTFRLGRFDAAADQYFETAIMKAGAAYAACRAINAAVSVIKGSNINAEPAGVGVTIAVGEVLDPLDDMTERTSDVLVTAIVALGIQKVLYELALMLFPRGLALLLLAFAVVTLADEQTLFHLRPGRFRAPLARVLLLLLIGRFALPAAALANRALYEHYFAEKISSAVNRMRLMTNDGDDVIFDTPPPPDGILGKLKEGAKFVKQKTRKLKITFARLKQNAPKIITTLLKLTSLYAGLFLVQVLLLPLGILWLSLKTANHLLSARQP